MLIIVHNRKYNFLVLGEGATDNINDIVGAANKTFCINFTGANTNFCLSLHYVKVICMWIKQMFGNLRRMIKSLGISFV